MQNSDDIDAFVSWLNFDSHISFTLVKVFSRDNQVGVGRVVVCDDSNPWKTLSITQTEL